MSIPAVSHITPTISTINRRIKLITMRAIDRTCVVTIRCGSRFQKTYNRLSNYYRYTDKVLLAQVCCARAAHYTIDRIMA